MTKRAEAETGAGIRVKSPLTELENDVMQAVWDAGPCTVEAVHQVVARNRNIKETSVRTLLRRLEQKGYLRTRKKGRAYVYRAAGRASDSAVWRRMPCGRLSTAFAGDRSRNW